MYIENSVQIRKVREMSQRMFAVFDIGTTGTRSVIVDEEGREISKAYEEYPQKPKEVQVHEQLADTFWRTSMNTMQRAISGCKYGSDAINGVIVTTDPVGAAGEEAAVAAAGVKGGNGDQ